MSAEPRDAASRRKFRSLREDFPVIFAFGEDPIEFLSHERSIAATPQERIRSVWPFLVKTVLKFAETLRPRAAANFDPEDVLTELWIALIEKDCKWEPDRGRYLTFVGKIVAHELHAIRDRAFTIHSPRNSSCRIKEYELADREGRLTDRRRSTLEDIRRVFGDHEAIEGNEAIAPSEPDTLQVIEERERIRLVRDAVKRGLKGLSYDEAAVLAATFGLWGGGESSLAQIARRRGRSIDSAKKAKGRAILKFRQKLEDLNHPAVAEDAA